jgi:aminoglycoside 3-N-acetyltransferase I
VIVRRLGPGDEAIVVQLAEKEPPRTELLQDDRVVFLVALNGDAPIGFVFGYELPRRHGFPSMFFVYELEVDAACRRQGVATRLLSELRRVCRERGIPEGFVFTEPENVAANATYASAGGKSDESVVMWEFLYGDS